MENESLMDCKCLLLLGKYKSFVHLAANSFSFGSIDVKPLHIGTSFCGAYRQFIAIEIQQHLLCCSTYMTTSIRCERCCSKYMLRVGFIVFALHEPNWPEVIYIVKNIHVVLLSLRSRFAAVDKTTSSSIRFFTPV